MITRTAEPSPRPHARVVGWLYLSLLPLTFLGILATNLIIPTDMATTTRNILASETFFRFGILISLIVEIVNIFVVLALYHLLKPANKNMASLMVIFYLIPIPMALVNELNSFVILFLAHDSLQVSGYTADQVHALMSLSLNIQSAGGTIAYIFYGLWLLPMGCAVFVSRFLPRIIGVLVIMSGVAYLLQSGITILFPDFGVNIGLVTFWGELTFPVWLVIRGVNVERWEKRSRASA